MENISKKSIDKIFENVKNSSCLPGMLVASNSKQDPDYFYHWIRDSAIVMKSIVIYYEKYNCDKAFKIIIGYINNEIEIQNMKSCVDVGEPKYNTNRTPYTEPWGRPQNDGPALRGLTMIRIYKLFSNEYPSLCKLIINCITKDLNYVMKNHNNHCFDLWEEIDGYHLYTRLVQCKFLKECLNIPLNVDYNKILNIKNRLMDLISHHNIRYTSFGHNGICCRDYDGSLLLGICHIDYDSEILEINNDNFKFYLQDIIKYFKNEYKINRNKTFTLLGRYKDDKYYLGNPWIITTVAMFQIKKYFENNNIKNNLEFLKNQNTDDFINYILKKNDFNLAEQIDKNNDNCIGAYNLNWNYSELFMLSLL